MADEFTALGLADLPDAHHLGIGWLSAGTLEETDPVWVQVDLGTLRAKLPRTRVFILTAFHDREKVFAALQAGAHGYLIKTSGAAKVLRTLHDVAQGGVPLDPQIAGMVLQAFQHLSRTGERIDLSDQETAVLRRIANGMTKKEVAQDMKLSLHTVDQYLRPAFDKLHVQSLPTAVAAAIRSGLLGTQ